MDITSMQEGDVTIVNLIGRIDSSVAGQFESSVMGFLDQGVNRMVLTFTALDYISSAGLRVLLMAAKRLKTSQGTFILCELKDSIQEVLDVSGFAAVLTIEKTLGEAMKKAS